MRAKIWYNGDVTISEAAYNPTSLEPLKRGNELRTGRYGAGARRKFISRCMYMHDSRGDLPVYSTCLTYRDQPEVEEARTNLNNFLQFLRRKGMKSYAWTLEVQERKKSKLAPTIHYHMLINAPYIPVKEMNEAWSRIRSDEAPNAVRDHRLLNSADKASRYATKYAWYMSKASEKHQDQENHLDLTGYRLWATSQSLTMKESVTINDSAFVVGMIPKLKESRQVEMETGYKVLIGKLSSIEKTMCYKLAPEIEALLESKNKAEKEAVERRTRENQERINREMQKSRQKALF